VLKEGTSSKKLKSGKKKKKNADLTKKKNHSKRKRRKHSVQKVNREGRKEDRVGREKSALSGLVKSLAELLERKERRGEAEGKFQNEQKIFNYEFVSKKGGKKDREKKTSSTGRSRKKRCCACARRAEREGGEAPAQKDRTGDRQKGDRENAWTRCCGEKTVLSAAEKKGEASS